MVKRGEESGGQYSGINQPKGAGKRPLTTLYTIKLYHEFRLVVYS